MLASWSNCSNITARSWRSDEASGVFRISAGEKTRSNPKNVFKSVGNEGYGRGRLVSRCARRRRAQVGNDPSRENSYAITIDQSIKTGASRIHLHFDAELDRVTSSSCPSAPLLDSSVPLTPLSAAPLTSSFVFDVSLDVSTAAFVERQAGYPEVRSTHCSPMSLMYSAEA